MFTIAEKLQVVVCPHQRHVMFIYLLLVISVLTFSLTVFTIFTFITNKIMGRCFETKDPISQQLPTPFELFNS